MNSFLLNILGISEEEYAEQQRKREAYEASPAYQQELEQASSAREAEYERILTDTYTPTNVIRATKIDLNRVIRWTSSRYNQKKKAEVVSEILHRFREQRDGFWDYGCGTYVPEGSCYGIDYRLLIYKGVAKLIVNQKTIYQIIK